jgi:hypothetical protein
VTVAGGIERAEIMVSGVTTTAVRNTTTKTCRTHDGSWRTGGVGVRSTRLRSGPT